MVIRCCPIAFCMTYWLILSPVQLAASQTITVRWADALNQPPAWYGTDEARRIANRMLEHQREHGGWPKNTDMTLPPDPAVLDAARKRPDSTIDNGATVTEMRFLVRVYGLSREPRYRDALLKSPGQEREREALFYPVK